MQLLLTHSALPPQVCPLTFLQLPEPSQALGATHMIVALVSTLPVARLVHVPREPAMLHALQVSVQALPQQMPSAQLPFTHCGLVMQVWPTFFLQPPAPSHELVPVHVVVPTVSGWLIGMLPQVPSDPLPFFAAVQARHVPLHATLQQTPSIQFPWTHSLLSVQVWPSFFLQVLAPSQALGLTHVIEEF